MQKQKLPKRQKQSKLPEAKKAIDKSPKDKQFRPDKAGGNYIVK